MPSSPRRLSSSSRAALARSLSLSLSLVACGGSGSTSSGSGGAGGAMSTVGSTGGGGAGGATSSTGGGGASASGGGGAGGSGCTPGTVQPCYSGPDGTKAVGICHEGTQTCLANGTLGACTGEVTPKGEDCKTPLDDDCNGVVNDPEAGCLCAPGESSACYSGMMGTKDVGQCVAGVHTCAADGQSYGECFGEVLPQLENCLVNKDEDCNGMAEACTGTSLWAKRFGDAVAQSGAAVALTPSGGAVVIGSFAGGADFGGGVLTSAGATDVFVASYDMTGALIWAKRFGDVGAQSGADVTVDAQGNVIVIGDVAGSIDFGGGALASAGATDVFVAKLDPTGAQIWARRFGDVTAQNGRGVAVDAMGNVLVTGAFAGKLDFGGGALTSAGATDIFLAKLKSANGDMLWGKRFGDAVAQVGKSVAVDGLGSVVVTGDMAGKTDFGGGNLTSAGATDVFVASFDGAGNNAWAKRFGDAGAQTAGAIAADAGGAIAIVGNVAGKIDFGGGNLTSAGMTDIYAAKFTAAGMFLWGKRFGAAGAENGRDVAIDPFGGIVITGDFPGSVDFGGGALVSAGATDVFAVKLDTLGGHVWSKRYGDVAAQLGLGVAADATGVALTGSLAGSMDFGGGALTSAGMTDIFLAKLAP
ncbi:MAG: hypothetical protein ABI193_16985 [Minicystis sp.]